MRESDFMTGYEKRIYKGYQKSQADLMKDNKMMANVVKRCLGVEVNQTLEDGTEINVPIAVELTAKKLAYWKEHPEKIDLKELSSVLGESKVEQEVSLRGADELFGDIVIKKEK